MYIDRIQINKITFENSWKFYGLWHENKFKFRASIFMVEMFRIFSQIHLIQNISQTIFIVQSLKLIWTSYQVSFLIYFLLKFKCACVIFCTVVIYVSNQVFITWLDFFFIMCRFYNWIWSFQKKRTNLLFF